MDKEKSIKILQKAIDLQKGKEISLAKEFIAINDKVDTVSEKADKLAKEVDEKLSEISEELKKKLESELVLEIDREELKGEDGKDGENYILTEADKKEIASSIEVPVVEKVIEKTEVIRETPIITNEIVEVAKYQTSNEIADGLNTLKEAIDEDVIKGLGKKLKDLNSNIEHNKLYTGISETRARELIDQLTTDVTISGALGIGVDNTSPSNPIISRNFIGARGFLEAGASISDSTYTRVSFDNETFDTNNNLENDGTFKVTEDGYYFVSATVTWKNLVTCFNFIEIRYNDDSTISTANYFMGGDVSIHIQDIVFIEANKYINIYVYQQSGVTADIAGGTSNTWFNVYKI